MAYQDRFYTIGDVTVENGSAVVTGTGTGWETALIDGGVIFVGGGSYPIYSVESETSLTLAYPFTGESGADLPYAVDRQRAAATSNIQMNDRLAQIIREISIGNIEELNAIDFTGNELLQTNAAGILVKVALAANKLLRTGADKSLTQSDITNAAVALLNLSGAAEADRLPYLTGASGAGLTPITAFARSLLDDPNPASMAVTLGNVWSFLGNGYCKLSFGLYVMWGNTSSTNPDYRVNFPTAFPGFVMYVNMINVYDYGGANNTYMAASTSNLNNSGFDARCRVMQNGGLVGPQSNLPLRWFAIGW
ncbi:gp53-like domain-containing protein [Ochrobactrum quorumnocens]|uniref:gp53-like domain-containing protein n=1 Tax=Ochrobactrum quorumnocens TaxID=271865 RepID=UPI003BA0138A